MLSVGRYIPTESNAARFPKSCHIVIGTVAITAKIAPNTAKHEKKAPAFLKIGFFLMSLHPLFRYYTV
jgi:hypothetical protein